MTNPFTIENMDNFYRVFQENFRGSRDSITSRFRIYLPFLNPLVKYYSPVKAIDLGCGRGEWMELIRDYGFEVQGIDIDDAMLESCRERGLNVHTQDALDFLKGLPAESQVVVSGFHIAEHIPFDDLKALVKEAMRILSPGGLLILETPNPENILVGSSRFYSDPTHQRPIPPELLAFLPEYFGFKKVKVLRLQESAELRSGRALSLFDVLTGVSPDYAVVAQKDGPVTLLDATNKAFVAEYGLTLYSLADRYHQDSVAKVQHAETRIQQLAEQIEAVYGSTSWRITEPIRRLKRLVDRFYSQCRHQNASGNYYKSLLRISSAQLIRYALGQASLKLWVKQQSIKYPLLYRNLRKFADRSGLIPGISSVSGSMPPISRGFIPVDVMQLSPRARKIYADLISAIDNNQESR